MSDNHPKIPTSIKVGCFIYKVQVNADLESIGETNTDRLLIEINPNFPLQILRETLLHECLHAILNDTFVVESKDEEKIVRVVSPGIMQIIMDNPELKAFLFD